MRVENRLRPGDGLLEGLKAVLRPEAIGISFSCSHSGGWDRIAGSGHRNLPLFPAGGEMPQVLPLSYPPAFVPSSALPSIEGSVQRAHRHTSFPRVPIVGPLPLTRQRQAPVTDGGNGGRGRRLVWSK